jgi:hypothetical protein
MQCKGCKYVRLGVDNARSSDPSTNSAHDAWRFTTAPEAMWPPSHTVNSHVHQTSQRFPVLGRGILKRHRSVRSTSRRFSRCGRVLCLFESGVILAVSGTSAGAPLTQSHLRERMKAFEWRLHCGTIASGFSGMSLIFSFYEKQPFSRSQFSFATSFPCATDAGLRRPSSFPFLSDFIAPLPLTPTFILLHFPR